MSHIGDPIPGSAWPTQPLPPQTYPYVYPNYTVQPDIPALIAAVERLAAAAEKIVEILEAKPKTCPTCSRISGHQPWCDQGKQDV